MNAPNDPSYSSRLKAAILKLDYASATQLVSQLTIEERIQLGIYCVLEVYNEPSFARWAEGWLSGKDRSGESARKVRDQAAKAAVGAAGEYTMPMAELMAKAKDQKAAEAAASSAEAARAAVEGEEKDVVRFVVVAATTAVMAASINRGSKEKGSKWWKLWK